MRRLQLIKPWRLSTIRQRLVEAREDQQGTVLLTPASAPTVESRDIVIRGNIDGRSAHRKQAPVSDVVCASRAMQSCR